LKEDFLTPFGYRKISNVLNEEGLKTPMGNVFSNTHVFSIYHKGLKRLERINRPDIIEVKDFNIEYFESINKFLKVFMDRKEVIFKYFSFHKYP